MDEKYMDNWTRKACADEIKEVIMFGETDRELLLRDITEIIDKYYAEVQDMGGKRWDTSSLIKRFRK